MLVMANNKKPSLGTSWDDLEHLRAKTRLLKLYSKYKRKGGWRGVQKYLKLPNVSYAFEFVTKGKLPGNPDIRKVLLRGRPARERKSKDMNPLMERLEYLMRQWHVGMDKAIKKKDLLVEIYGPYAVEDQSYNNPYDRELRNMIEELNHDHNALICSTPSDGYFWASSLSEGLSAVEASTRRAATQMDNAHHLERNLKQAFGGQLSMEV
jgi:hypothetical protein